MNAASFGKLIRSVFVGLKTRRLGTRGNSKYHYYGIRVKPTSPLNQYTDDVNNMMSLSWPGRSYTDGNKKYRPGGQEYDGDEPTDHNQTNSVSTASNNMSSVHQLDPAQQARIQEHQQYLGDASMALTEFPGILSGNIHTVDKQIALPEGISIEDLLSFESLYRDHCESILDIVVNLQFSLLESLWSSFWKRDDDGEDEMEEQLPKYKLLLLCKMELVQSYMRQCDHAFYQSLVEVLIPDVLRPIPSTLTQAIRNFAKSLEGWANSTMNELPTDAFHVKSNAVNAFSQTLRRYTSLNHLAQAARAVLQNSSQISQMLNDLNRVDFTSVQEQAAWVCQCEDSLVQSLERDFKRTLQQQTSLEDWASWLEGVVSQVCLFVVGSK
jgi:regulatory factor X 1/2/3